MEQQKLIEGYRPIINHTAIGYTYYKLFLSLNNTTKTAVKQLKEYLKLQPGVIYLVEAIGFPADIDIELMVRTNQELFSFIEALKFKFPALAGDYQTFAYQETLKLKYLPQKHF